MIRVLFILAVLLSTTPAATADPVDDYVRGVMAAKKLPGASVAILRSGTVVKIQGYGLANIELDTPATPDTIYQSGSLGKQFTAAGILLLAEDGKLALDDRLAKHFPEGPSTWHRITVRHLLTHTSGLKDYGSDEIDFRRDYSEEDLLKIARSVPLEFEPGTQWSYSNTGYLILGLLTSRLAGKHWSDFQTERIFQPLGMATTRVISERDIVRNRAAGYELDDKGEVKNQEWVAPSLNRLADGALYFSVKDLAAWEAALHARRFMKPASFEAWWTPASLGAGSPTRMASAGASANSAGIGSSNTAARGRASAPPSRATSIRASPSSCWPTWRRPSPRRWRTRLRGSWRPRSNGRIPPGPRPIPTRRERRACATCWTPGRTTAGHRSWPRAWPRPHRAAGARPASAA